VSPGSARLRPIREGPQQTGQRVVDPRTGAEFELLGQFESGPKTGHWQARVIDPGEAPGLDSGRNVALDPKRVAEQFQQVEGQPREDVTSRKAIAELTPAERKVELERLRKLEVTDPLTGLGNKTAGERTAKKRFQGAA